MCLWRQRTLVEGTESGVLMPYISPTYYPAWYTVDSRILAFLP